MWSHKFPVRLLLTALGLLWSLPHYGAFRDCPSQLMTYFQYLQSSMFQGGYFHNSPEGSSDVCGAACRIQSATSYLPEPGKHFLHILHNLTMNDALAVRGTHCDKILSQLVSMWIPTFASRLTSRPHGYLHSHCPATSENLLNFVSYYAKMTYNSFQGTMEDVFNDFSNANDTNHASTSFVSLKECQQSKLANFHCLFQPILDVDVVYYPRTSSFDFNILTQLFTSRTTQENHIIQFLLISKIVGMVLRPNLPVQHYLLQHTVSLNSYRYVFGTSACEVADRDASYCSKKTFPDIDAFLAFTRFRPFHPGVPLPALSVSLHAFIEEDECSSTDTTTVDSACRMAHSKSVADAIEEYMGRLLAVHEVYNVLRVYLMTNSQAVIDYAKANTQFTWVFLDNDDGRRGPSVSDPYYAFNVAANLYLMRFGDVFIGPLSHPLSRLGFYALTGEHMRVPIFLSTNGTLGCAPSDEECLAQPVEAALLSALSPCHPPSDSS